MEAAKIAEVAGKVTQNLIELESPFQAAVLADVVALWLAGHLTDKPGTTQQLRQQLFDGFNQAVIRLLPSKDALVRENLKNLRKPR